MATTPELGAERAESHRWSRVHATRMRRVGVGTKLLLLALLPVCCVVVLIVVSALSDYRTADRLSRYRTEARLSFVLAPLAVDLARERRAAAMVRLRPGAMAQAQLAAFERATTEAFDRARARAVHVAAPVDVAGDLDAARRQRQSLVLQLGAGSLDPEQAIAGYSAITENVIAIAAALDGGAPSSASARAASAYGSIVQAIESASRESVFVATLLAPRVARPQQATDPWGQLETAELGAFRQNAAGPLDGDLQSVLFSSTGTAVQRFRDELAAKPAATIRGTSLQHWLSISSPRIDALLGVATAAGRSLDVTVSDELGSSRNRAGRDLALSLVVLALVTSVALALRRSIARPLREVAAGARGLARGDIAAGVEFSSRDEIGEVAAAFRDVHATAERLVDEIWAGNRAVRENQLDHRADVRGLEGVWAQLVAGMNETMASFAELQKRRERAERETARIFEMSPDPLCVIGFDGYFKRVNPAAARTLGYSREELLSRRGFDLTHPDDLERSTEVFSALRQGGQLEQFENRNICADGSVRWLEWSARAVPGEGVVYAVARDVTERRRAAEEQAALRRVATLVARAAAPDQVFAAVAAEAGKLLSADIALIGRYGAGPTVTAVVGWRADGKSVPLGTDVELGGRNVMSLVFSSGGPVRLEAYSQATGELATLARAAGIGCAVGVPIQVGGRPWGVMMVSLEREEPLPPGIEERLVNFTDLAATAIANADGRAQLVAARRRVIEATDEARAQLARDIHDGAQQQFLTALIDLQLAQEKRASDPERSRELVDLGAAQVKTGIETLRGLAAGLHPAILSDLGLRAALEALAAQMPFPLSIEVEDLELSPAVEASVYFFCVEALTNVVKHAAASTASCLVQAVDGELSVQVHDDGIGGAELGSGGSGLIGLRDRIGALEGSLEVMSPLGRGTTLTARIPLAAS